jgi:hypothetical protein
MHCQASSEDCKLLAMLACIGAQNMIMFCFTHGYSWPVRVLLDANAQPFVSQHVSGLIRHSQLIQYLYHSAAITTTWHESVALHKQHDLVCCDQLFNPLSGCFTSKVDVICYAHVVLSAAMQGTGSVGARCMKRLLQACRLQHESASCMQETKYNEVHCCSASHHK